MTGRTGALSGPAPAGGTTAAAFAAGEAPAAPGTATPAGVERIQELLVEGPDLNQRHGEPYSAGEPHPDLADAFGASLPTALALLAESTGTAVRGLPGQTRNGSAQSGRRADERVAGEGIVDERSVDGGMVDERIADGRIVEGPSADGLPADGAPTDVVPTDVVPTDGAPAEDRTPEGAARRAAAPLSGGTGGPGALEPLLRTVLDALTEGAARRGGPLPAGTPGEIAARVAWEFAATAEDLGTGTQSAMDPRTGDRFGTDPGAAGQPRTDLRAGLSPDPRTGPRTDIEPGDSALHRLTALLAHGTTDPADPSCAAHLHCPPLAVAVAADLAVSALNPSQDSWDQAPAATTLETLLLEELAALVGYDPAEAAGVLTSGGTESNLMGLMLARDRVLGRASGQQIEMRGVPGATGPRPRIFASAAAHFSVQRAAALLGLGEDAVVPVPVDHELRIDPQALRTALQDCADRGELPLAVVATAGTTDTGAVDPLRTCAALAAEYGAWLHVDAAYGGGALLSDRLAPLLDGIALADSVSLDWHKLGWQPVAAGVFLVRQAETYASLARRAVYLNPQDDEEAGYPSLLGLSLRTTRRADAFKIAVTLRTLGREGLGRLVDACHDLAHDGAKAVTAHPRLELHAEPVLTAFLFRYLPAGADPAQTDRVNAGLRRRLLREGRAVVGRTELPGDGPGRVRLKLTLLNPHTTPADVERLLHAVAAAGQAEEDAL
ncbi:pyridoxal phosphate-dependent decarboxylase family protein [Streptomyces sp. NPDC048639]|uniref:pyridoxal phosphate-dependent decarboxylase family protein n=1 Tax=Streptomyces sp. NPDC048639 TaxID=3365581 RepID=UPI00371845DC